MDAWERPGPESNEDSKILISHPNQKERPHFGAFLFDLPEGETAN